MKINSNSPFWSYPGEQVDLIFQNRFDACLQAYEDRLVDEYIECQIHINALDPSGQHIQWWVGNKERIMMETEFYKTEYGVTFDKVYEVFQHFPKYTKMSVNCQRTYRNIMGRGELD